MSKYQDIIGKIQYVLFLITVALLPFPQVFLRYACVCWGVSWLLEGRWLSRPLSWRENKVLLPLLLFGAWFALQLISGLWASDHVAWAQQIERYLLFALIIPVGIWGLNSNYNLRQASKVLVMSCVVAVPFYVILLWALYSHPDWQYFFNLSEPLKLYDDFRLFLLDNISLFKHRLFLCSAELFAVVMAVQIWHKQKWPLLPTVPILLSIIPLTASRQSIITVTAMMAVGVICMLPHAYRWWVGTGVIFVAMFLGGGMLMLHPRMQHFEIEDVREVRTMSYEHEPRLNIWVIALEHPKDYLAHGIGAGQSTDYLVEKYMQHGLYTYALKRYNAHNQYIEEMIELGVPGLLLFLLAWMSIPLCTKGASRRTAWLLCTLFVFNMFTDVMFGRFCGIALWAVVMLFIMLQSYPQRKQ